ncbi:HAMP domain-containing sensor histidine kinase [Hymenobacter sp. GOD-10R]|uniref:HAMP domain-containing sensor histidine kinase n=1 Tax=Hymenobacter sp. GOD-10R TaxID=3093922 RepID=UPI002D767D0D|nr:ATP-binding protein [Hymenobacter sp. GOD-10R]WRQ26717.1 ATP-binding protein [Hymenobacter sp. GOD-10R]
MRALRGLRTQLALAFACVFGAATLVAGFYQYQQVGRVLHQRDDQRLHSRATTLLDRVEVEPQPVVPLPSRGERLRVVVEHAGQPTRELFHSPGFAAPSTSVQNGWRVVEVQQLHTGETGATYRIRLWLAHSGAPLTADLGHVRQGLAWTLVGSLALAAVLATWLGGRVLRPLRRISEQARRIRTMPGTERLLEPDTGDEVQELAHTLNQMLDRLQVGAALQDNFLSAAAHELRTPLAVLQAGLAVTRQAPELPTTLQEPLDAQLRELHRLGRLVEDFLLVSRLRTDALPLSRHPVALDGLVVEAADRLLPQFQAAGRMLHLAIDEQVATYTVAADADKLTTVVLNLLDNALRHAPPGAAVQVRLGKEPTTGWGYAEVSNPLQQSLGDLSRLTTAHYQADVLSGGAGLGLWISNRIAELHGAPLVLQEADGYFTVRLRLPLLSKA